MPLIPDVLPALDTVRAVAGLLGMRVFAVTVRKRVWTGERPGVGTKTDTDIAVTNAGALPATPVRVQYVSAREIVASGGLYQDRDLRVGPITPTFAATLGIPAGGFDGSTLDPATTSSATELFWKVTGPGMPTGGIWCSLIDARATSMHYSLVLRAGGAVP